MLKPLSEKTLRKKYAELGIRADKLELLKKYFLCFSNLYGVITLGEAWEIFGYYEGKKFIGKKAFFDFTEILRREPDCPYRIYELTEVYSGEEKNIPEERLIINNILVLSGYIKFNLVYNIEERQGGFSPFLPDRETFLSFSEDRFYLTPEGRKMRMFVENLKTFGIERNFNGEKTGKLTDLNGNPVRGKKLSDCSFLTHDEKETVEYYKSEAKKKKLLETYSVKASEKILKKIKRDILAGNIFPNESSAVLLSELTDFLKNDFDVRMSDGEFSDFSSLYMNLNNRSNLWLNYGNRPCDLMPKNPTMPKYVSIGPNMKKMFESGELDRKDIEKQMKKLGITIVDE